MAQALYEHVDWKSGVFKGGWSVSANFSAHHGMPARTSDEAGFRPSVVCLSNAWIATKRKKDLSIFLHHTKDHLAYSFLRRRMVCGSDPFCLKFWINWPPLERNCRFGIFGTFCLAWQLIFEPVITY